MSGTNAEQAAWAELDRLTDGSPGRLWRWNIPADPERDSDLILAAGLKAVADERDAALSALKTARAEAWREGVDADAGESGCMWELTNPYDGSKTREPRY